MDPDRVRIRGRVGFYGGIVAALVAEIIGGCISGIPAATIGGYIGMYGGVYMGRGAEQILPTCKNADIIVGITGGTIAGLFGARIGILAAEKIGPL